MFDWGGHLPQLISLANIVAKVLLLKTSHIANLVNAIALTTNKDQVKADNACRVFKVCCVLMREYDDAGNIDILQVIEAFFSKESTPFVSECPHRNNCRKCPECPE